MQTIGRSLAISIVMWIGLLRHPILFIAGFLALGACLVFLRCLDTSRRRERAARHAHEKDALC